MINTSFLVNYILISMNLDADEASSSALSSAPLTKASEFEFQ